MFQFNTTLSYGLRLLINLGFGDKTPKSLSRIAKEEGISLLYLRKLIISLERAGIVKSLRGPGGGFLLKKRPEEIKLDEVVNIFSRSKIMDCIKGEGSCLRYQDCIVKDLLEEVYQALKSVFKNKTLATVMKRRLK